LGKEPSRAGAGGRFKKEGLQTSGGSQDGRKKKSRLHDLSPQVWGVSGARGKKENSSQLKKNTEPDDPPRQNS